MNFPRREIVERIKQQYPIGCRVELVRMDDPQAPPIGTCGTVTGVDDTGSLLMRWDNGSGLNVVYGEDQVRKLYSVCPKCGKAYTDRPALSRDDNKTLICPDCGTREALDAIGVKDALADAVIEAMEE